MISLAGHISGFRNGSYVYLIAQGACLYFGETGDLPPKRWGQHLASNGTFFKLLNKIPETLDQEMLFIGVRCLDVDKVLPLRRKLARRAIEEELHRRFFLDSQAFGCEFSMVSTPPAPPVRFAWPFEPSTVAQEIFSLFVIEYKNWRARTT